MAVSSKASVATNVEKVVERKDTRNRATRRGSKWRRLPKQFHLQGKEQVRMMMVERGLIKRK